MLNIEFASSLGQGLWQFVSYMGLAIFAENVILARALGVTRLMKLVPDHKAQVWDLCLPLIWVMTLSAPLGWAAHNLLFPWLRSCLPAWLPISALRPVVYLTCGVAAMAVTWLGAGPAAPQNAPKLPQPAQPGHLQHCHAGHAAHQFQPELHAGAIHCVWSGQRPGLHLHRLHRA